MKILYIILMIVRKSMKTNKFIQFALLVSMIFASMSVATTQGKSGSVEYVQVSITGIDLGDLDGRGQINDATIHGNLRIYFGAAGSRLHLSSGSLTRPGDRRGR